MFRKIFEKLTKTDKLNEDLVPEELKIIIKINFVYFLFGELYLDTMIIVIRLK